MIIIQKHVNYIFKGVVIQIAICIWITASGYRAAEPAISPATVEMIHNPENEILYQEEKRNQRRYFPLPKDSREELGFSAAADERNPAVMAGTNHERFEASQGYTMYATVRVNFREEPNTEAAVLAVLRPNTQVTVLDHTEGWYQIRYGESDETEEQKVGYIKDNYLSEEEQPMWKLNQWGIALTPEEIDLLAQILWVEARGEPYEGQVAVVEVIFNRMASKTGEFPENDLEGIVSSTVSGVQFASWKLRHTAQPGEDLYRVIYDVLEGNAAVLPSRAYVFFTTEGIGRNIVRIGHHLFGTL